MAALPQPVLQTCSRVLFMGWGKILLFEAGVISDAHETRKIQEIAFDIEIDAITQQQVIVGFYWSVRW